MSGITVETFYKNRLKTPNRYGYSATGDLVVKDKAGGIVQTITIPNYRAPTDEELASMAAERTEAIEAAQTQFEETRRILRTATAEGNDPAIRRAMAEVTLADGRLQAARYAERNIAVYTKYFQVRHIDMEDPRNEHKMPETYIFQASPFSVQNTWCRIAEPGEVIAAPAALEDPVARRPRTVLIISLPDGENGFLSEWWPVAISFEDGEHKNAYQAILSEMARTFKQPDIAEEIQDAATPEEVSYTWSDFEGATEESWNRELERLTMVILRAKFAQHPDLADQLVNTGRAVLGYVPPEDPTDTFQGIGLAAENPMAKLVENWVGQNMVGKTLGLIRKELVDLRKATGAPILSARLKRKPIGATGAGATAAATVGSALSTVVAGSRAALGTAASAVGAATGAVADSLIDLFGPATAAPAAPAAPAPAAPAPAAPAAAATPE